MKENGRGFKTCTFLDGLFNTCVLAKFRFECFVNCEGQSLDTVTINHNFFFSFFFLENGESKRGNEPMSFAYQPKRVTIGPIGSSSMEWRLPSSLPVFAYDQSYATATFQTDAVLFPSRSGNRTVDSNRWYSFS